MYKTFHLQNQRNNYGPGARGPIVEPAPVDPRPDRRPRPAPRGGLFAGLLDNIGGIGNLGGGSYRSGSRTGGTGSNLLGGLNLNLRGLTNGIGK